MSDLTSFPNPTDTDDERPLPLIVAEKWRFPLTHVETPTGFLYAVQDWIKGLIEVSNVATVWADIKRRANLPELLASIQQLPYTASNGKTYQMDFTDDKGLYFIAQHLRVTKSRKVLDAIKKYLAEAGAFADEARRDPETATAELERVAYQREYNKLIAEGFTPDEATQWIEVRLRQKHHRRIITTIWNSRGIKKPGDFADLTNQVHRIALGRTATRHKRELAVKDSPRNYVSAADNATIQITEFTSGLLHDHRESFGKPELSEDIDDVRPIIDAARPEIHKVFSQKPRRLPGAKKPQLSDQ
jgi:hypothetical protein